MNSEERSQKIEARRQKYLFGVVRGLWPVVCGLQRTTSDGQRTKSRSGLTLIELLIVIVILGVVTVATIPIVLPALDSRRIRESARLLSTQLAAAQMLAISTGRPAGLLIERLPGDNTGAMDLHLCEVPLPYAGDTVDSVVNVQVTSLSTVNNKILTPGGSPQNNIPVYVGSLTINTSVDASATGLLKPKPDDLVQFGYRGPLYQILDVGAAGGGFPTTLKFLIEPIDADDFLYDYTNYPTTPRSKIGPKFRCLPPPAFAAAGWTAPYQVHRQPAVAAGQITKSASQVVQLPAGTVVDLFYSGVSGNTFTSPLPTGSLVIMFAPTGALQDVYFTSSSPTPVDGPVHLLVGKREKLTGTAGNVGDHNLYDLESIWVSVNPQTGLTTSAEMAAVPGVNYDNRNAIAFSATHISPARQFATSAQGMGGR